ncbi:hypothetical protein O3P69_013750 [Scylla paramamosain]|uniref:Uncharacterized protein n=1 Tax=Scylla paramamosain TaxID=85552 RepID=A0AAW0SPN4_SCYPA
MSTKYKSVEISTLRKVKRVNSPGFIMLFCIRMSEFTQARGSDVELLDVIFTKGIPEIDNLVYKAPIGNSDHSVSTLSPGVNNTRLLPIQYQEMLIGKEFKDMLLSTYKSIIWACLEHCHALSIVRHDHHMQVETIKKLEQAQPCRRRPVTSAGVLVPCNTQVFLLYRITSTTTPCYYVLTYLRGNNPGGGGSPPGAARGGQPGAGKGWPPAGVGRGAHLPEPWLLTKNTELKTCHAHNPSCLPGC